MPRRSMKHCGGNSSPAQQRINRAKSVTRFSQVIQLNFSGGARLIVLTYDPGGYIPAGVYAEPDIAVWIRLSARKLGGAFQYVRTTAQDPAPVHRVITGIGRAEAEALAGLWSYGPAWVEDLELWQIPVLAQQIIGKASAFRRSWTASKGLKRL